MIIQSISKYNLYNAQVFKQLQYIDLQNRYTPQLQKMEIQQCPILHPTTEQFDNFYEYIHFIDQRYKNHYGMVKVVPPAGWQSKTLSYESNLQKLEVKNAIEQNVQGRGGFYESKNIVQKRMTYKAYKRYSQKQSSKVKGKTSGDKQKLFWKTITYSPPTYGADLTGSLMDDTAGAWNLNKLDSLLKYAVPYRVKGVTEPYCYIGTWKAFFSWHKEDLDLSAINYIHEGEPKIWYSIAPSDSHILEDCAKQHYRTQYLECKQFLRHKTFLIHPEMLLKEYPELKISKVVHNAGEFMLVFGGAYHEGFNCGFNIAEAVNYATLDWLSDILVTKPCSCSRKSVKVSIQSILYNLEESEMFEQLFNYQPFQKMRNYVQQKQEEELALQKEHQIQNIYPEAELIKQQKQNLNNQALVQKVESNAKGKTQSKKAKTKQIKKSKPPKHTDKILKVETCEMEQIRSCDVNDMAANDIDIWSGLEKEKYQFHNRSDIDELQDDL